jgi:biopolymer transport protein ExbD
VNFHQTRGRARPEPRLEITSLIDVVFLLLIFFLITTSFVRDDERELPLNLPKAAMGQAPDQGEKITLFVQEDGSLRLGDEQLRRNEIRPRLEKLYGTEPGIQLNVKADRDTAYGLVTTIIDEARGVGFEKVNLVVKRKRKP